MMISHRITFITPLFSRGSYDSPEIRPPSIRGQLHWWFRALNGTHAAEKQIFGGVHGGAVASKVIVRVSGVAGNTGSVATLPHKQGALSSEKTAFLPGTHFDLCISERLGGVEGAFRSSFLRSIDAWLLAGTLGLRSTRAGGSFVWEPLLSNLPSMPQDHEAYSRRLTEVFAASPIKVMLLRESFTTAEAARKCVSDTLGGRDDHHGANNLASLRHPLGKIFNGRKTSPLRFRIIKLGNSFKIVAVWDNRSAVTGNQPNDLVAVSQLLENSHKRIGSLLVAEL